MKPEVQKAAPPIEVPALPLDELKEKTDNFGSKALIGEGSYGRVYYANLENGKAVAVKKLDVSSEPESNVEFFTQVYLKLHRSILFFIITLLLLIVEFTFLMDMFLSCYFVSGFSCFKIEA